MGEAIPLFTMQTGLMTELQLLLNQDHIHRSMREQEGVDGAKIEPSLAVGGYCLEEVRKKIGT